MQIKFKLIIAAGLLAFVYSNIINFQVANQNRQPIQTQEIYLSCTNDFPLENVLEREKARNFYSSAKKMYLTSESETIESRIEMVFCNRCESKYQAFQRYV